MASSADVVLRQLDRPVAVVSYLNQEGGTQHTVERYIESSVSNGAALPNTHDNVQDTMAGFIANVEHVEPYVTNVTASAALVTLPLEVTPTMDWSFIAGRSYLNPPLGEQNIYMDWVYDRPGYTGCAISNYPSNYAFASNYVARYQVFLLVDEYEEGSTTDKRETRWRQVCDETDPTELPTWDYAAQSANFTGYYPLTTNAFEMLCSDHHSVPSGPWYNYSASASEEIKTVITAYAVVVDWKWKHFGVTPFVPFNNVPEWAQ